VKKDGTKFTGEINSSLLRDASGKPRGTISVIRDITERKRAEEALRESEEKYRALIEAAGRVGEGIIIIQDSEEHEGAFVFVNDRFCTMSGYSREELLGRSAWGLVPHEISVWLRDWYKRRHMGESLPTYYEAAGVRKDGAIVPLELSVVTMPWQGRTATALYLRDITERKQAEEEIKKLAKFPEENPFPILRLNQEGIILYANKASQALLQDWGCTVGNYAPKFWRDLVAEALSRQSKRTIEVKFDEQTYLIDVVPILDSGYVNLYGEDITERKRAEEALEKNARLLRDTGEMAKVGGWELDLSTKEISWTEEVGRIHGVEPGYKPKLEEALDFYAPESRPDVEAVVKKAAETGEPYDLESLFIPSGSKDKIWVRSLGRAVYSGGKIVKLTGTFQNIDKYKRAEGALRESEATIRALIDSPVDSILLVNPDGIILDTNQTFAQRIGRRVDELIGRCFYDFLPPDLAKSRRARVDEIVHFGVPIRFEDEHAGMQLDQSAHPIFDAQGKVTKIAIVARDVTERKRTEEALREREQEIRVIAENVPALFSYIDANGYYRFVNKRYEEWFGVPQTEIIGKHCRQVLGESTYELIKGYVEAALSGQRVHYEENLLYAHDSRRWVVAEYVPDVNDRGSVRGFYALVTDITERKRVEEALRRKSEEQDLLLNNIQTQVWYLTDKETYGAINKARAEFFGKKNEEMENKKFYDVLSKDEAEICMSGYVEVFEKRKQVHTEEWITSAKGEKRLLSIIKSPKLNENGEVEYVVCSAEDITERKRAVDGIKKLNEELERRVIERTAQLEAINKDMQKEITERNDAEEALKASEISYRRLFESAMDGILLLDADTGQITNVNPYLIEMLGYSHNEFLGKKLWEVGLFKHIAESQAGFQKLQSEKYIRYENLPLESKEGRHIDVEFVSNVYLEDRQKVIQCNIRDITERRRAEEELKKHEERLEELVRERTQQIRELEGQRAEIEKLAAAGLVAARIAHEINNPLAGIKNSFLLVKDAIPQDHPYYNYVERIDNEINRIAGIVRQMFDVYRPEQEIKKEFSVDKTLYEVVALLEAARWGNNITIEIDSKPITMVMPEGLLRQVLYNILLNAIEASPQGGVVKIMTEVDNEILTLLISDQGVGIPLEVQPRIFEPFFTSKHGSQKGLGLGLAVSKDIVEKLGGHIDFESEPGKGTLFRIILPLKSGERR